MSGIPNKLKLTREEMFQAADKLRHPQYDVPAVEGDLPFEPLVPEDKGLLRGMHQGDVRARNQPNSRAILNSIVQIGSTIVGDAVSGAGYLGELGDINDITQGTETEWGNWLVDLGQSIKEKGEEIAPVYASQQALTTFAPWDGEWWASNIPSIGSTLALAIPAAGAVGLVGRFGKALGIARKMSAATGKAIAGISSGIISRHIENMMESKEVFDNAYAEALKQGRDEETAKQVAGRAASDSYNANYINLLTDIPQYLALFGVKLPGFGAKTGKLGAVGGSFASEAAEEATQFIIQQESERGARLELGEKDDSTFGSRFVKYLQDPGLQTAAFFGGLGGAVFGAVGQIIDRADKNPEEVRKEATVDIAKKAVEKGDFSKEKQMLDAAKTEDLSGFGSDAEVIQRNLKEAEDVIRHTERVFNSLLGDPYQKDKAKLAAEAKVIEQELQRNSETTGQIAAAVGQDQFDYHYTNMQLEALKGVKGEQAANLRESLKATLAEERFKKPEEGKKGFTPNAEPLSPYVSTLKQLAKQRVDARMKQGQVNNAINKFETPEGREELANEMAKQQKQIEKQVISEAQESKTPEQLDNYRKQYPNLNQQFDKIAEAKAQEEKKLASVNPDDYNIPVEVDRFLADRYDNKPFLLQHDLKRKGFDTLEQFKQHIVDYYQKQEAQPGSEEELVVDAEIVSEDAEAALKETNESLATLEDAKSSNIIEELKSEQAAQTANDKVSEAQEVTEYYDREPSESELILQEENPENPFLGQTNDAVFYRIVEEDGRQYVEFSGFEKRPRRPIDDAKEEFNNIKDWGAENHKWRTLYDNNGNAIFQKETGSGGYRHNAEFDYEALRTLNGGQLQGRAVWFEVDERNYPTYEEGTKTREGWEMLRILARVEDEVRGEPLTLAMIKAHTGKIASHPDASKLAAFRKDVFDKYQEWKKAGNSGVFRYSLKGELEEIYSGRFWSVPTKNSPKNILRQNEEFVLAVGVTQNTATLPESNGAGERIGVERNALNQLKPGAVYQAIKTANGKYVWSRLFTKRLSNESVKGKPGLFPTWEKHYGATKDVKETSLKQIVLDLLRLANNPKVWKEDWTGVKDEVQSIVRFPKKNKPQDKGPDFNQNLSSKFDKFKEQGQTDPALGFYNLLNLDDRPIQIDSRLVNTKIGDQDYNDLIADRLETDVNGPGAHTHSPKFLFKLPEVSGEVRKQLPENDAFKPRQKYDPDVKFRLADSIGHYEPLDQDKAVNYLKKKYPNIPISVFKSIVAMGNREAYGMFYNGGIALSEKAAAGTEFHEEFHLVFNLGLNDNQRQIILSEARKKYGKDISDNQLEEYLADEFMEYIQSQSTTLSNRIKRFFNRLWNLIKFAITNKLTIDYLFDRIDNKVFSGITLDRSKFAPKFKLLKSFRENGGTLHEQRMRIRESLHFFDRITQAVVDVEQISLDEALRKVSTSAEAFNGEYYIAVAPDGTEVEVDSIKTRYKNQRDNIEGVEGKIKEEFDRVINSLESGEFANEIRRRLGSRGVYVVEATANSDEAVFEDEEQFLESWQKKSLQISPIENLSGRLKRFLDNVPKQRTLASGESVPILSSLGFQMFHDGKFMYADLQSRIGGAVDVTDMLRKLEEQATRFPQYQWILDRVNESKALRAELFRMAQKVHPVFIDVVKDNAKYGIKTAGTESLARAILSDWHTIFYNTSINRYLGTSGVAVHKDELQSAWNKVKGKTTPENFSEFLSRFGITVDVEVLANAANDNKLGEVTSLFGNFITAFINASEDTMPTVFDDQQIRKFAEAIANYYPITYQSAHINIEGEREYEWINSSYLGKMMNHLKQGGEAFWSMLRSDVLYTQLLDNNVIRPEVWKKAQWSVVGGIKHHKGRGTGYTSFSDKDTVITFLSMFKEGWYPTSINSSSSPVLSAIQLIEGRDNYIKNRTEVLNRAFEIANAEWARANREDKYKEWKNYTPKSYAFFGLTAGQAPTKAAIEEKFQKEYLDLRTKIEDLGLIKDGKLTFDTSLETDIFLQSFVYNFNLRQAEIILLMQGDPNFYKHDKSGSKVTDFFKRAREIWSPGNYLDVTAEFKTEDGRTVKFHRDQYNLKVLRDVETPSPQQEEIRENVFKVVRSEQIAQGKAEEEAEKIARSEADSIANQYNKSSLTDAQSYIDLYSYRLRMLGEQRWTNEMQKAYDILITGQSTKAKNLKVDGKTKNVKFQPIKPFYYALQAYKTLVYPMQNKDSEFLLIPEFANGNPKLEAILEDMGYSKTDSGWSFDEEGRNEGKYTDKVSFDTAVKVALDAPFVGDTLETATPVKMNWGDWRRQMETPEHHLDTDSRFGTQSMKLVFADLADDADFSGSLATDFKGDVDKVFDLYPQLKKVGTTKEYLNYLNSVFPSSVVKEIMFRGSEKGIKSGSHAWLYLTNNYEEAKLYGKNLVTKSGRIEERNPIGSIFKGIKSKYKIPDDVSSVLATSEASIEVQLELGFITEQQAEKASRLLQSIPDLQKWQEMSELYQEVKIEEEDDLLKEVTHEGFKEKRKRYITLRQELGSYFSIDDVGKVEAVVVNSKNPLDGRNAEDLESNLEAYKNGHDGAYLMQKDHFLVRNADQVHVLGTEEDVKNFRNFKQSAGIVTGKDVKKRLEELIITDIVRSSNELMSRFSIKEGDEIKINKPEFIKILREEVAKRQLGDQYLDALNEIDGDTAIPLFHPLHSYRIESLISALFKNNITKQKFITGVSLFNVSAYGVENAPKILWNEDGSIDAIECYAPVYSSYLERYRRNDGKIDIDSIREQEPELLEGLVYRIPTEDKYSMFNIRIKGFLPDTIGGGIILPHEITTIAGLDFDIDKTYGFFHTPPGTEDQEIQRKEEELKALIDDELEANSLDTQEVALTKARAKYANLITEIEELKEEAANTEAKRRSDNEKLALMKNILKHPSMTTAFLRPGGFDTIRSTAKRIQEMRKDEGTGDTVTNPNTLIKMVRRINSGAALTGIAANYNSSKARWQKYNLSLKDASGFRFFGRSYKNLSAIDVDDPMDKTGILRKISRNIAEVLASAVDNGKEPLAEIYNLNSYTADVAMSMLATGIPLKVVMFFLSQPSIVKYVNDYFNTGSETPIEVPKVPPEIGVGENEKPSIKELTDGIEANDITGPNQEKFLSAFVYYKKMVSSVSDLVIASKVPDNGAGPMIADTVARQRMYNPATIAKGINGATEFLGSRETSDLVPSFHNAFVRYGIDQALNVFAELGFPRFDGKSGLRIVLDEIEGSIKKSNLTAKELTVVYQNFMDYLASGSDIFSSEAIAELHKNLGDRVAYTQDMMKRGKIPTYDFLNRLVVDKDKVIRFRSVVSIHKEELDDFRQSWAEMLKDDTIIAKEYRVSDLAKDLVKYSFFRSGFRLKPLSGNFSHLQPIEFYTDTVEGRAFNKSIKQQVEAQANAVNPQAYARFVSQFVRNNFRTLWYIPEVDKNQIWKDKDGNVTGISVDPEELGNKEYVKYISPIVTDPSGKRVKQGDDVLFKLVGGVYARIQPLGLYSGNTQVFQVYDFDVDSLDNPFEPTGEPREYADPKNFVNFTGGAKGADTVWKQVGSEYGISRTRDFTPADLDSLTPEQMDEVEWAYQEAWRQLGRRELAENTYAGKLVRRDYLQAKKADAVFAISSLVETVDKTNDEKRIVVAGGTGYAVQMAINLGKPVYVYDQSQLGWFTYVDGEWKPTTTPVLTRNFAGIGTREITDAGRQAIEDVFNNTFGPRQSESKLPEDHGKRVEMKSLEGEATQLSLFEENKEVVFTKGKLGVGEEISSYSDKLAFALTNPTHTSPKGYEWNRKWSDSQSRWRNYLSKGIEFEGTVYRDVEEAYQKNKHKHPIGEQRDNFMLNLLKIKLQTYPKLIEGIKTKGGIDYLRDSTHQPTKQNSHWETGGGNAFIELLTKAYQQTTEGEAVQPENVEVEEQASSVTEEIVLNSEQQEAAGKIRDYIVSQAPKDNFFVLEGKAGTGKTTVLSKVLKEVGGQHIVVAALAHKAKSVLQRKLKDEGVKVKGYSVAGLLGMNMNEETGEFEINPFSRALPPIAMADVIVIDEASMINEEALSLINSMKQDDAKVIFAGDVGQLPPIRKEKSDDNSPAFDSKLKVKLETRVRQGEESPILPYADYYWNNSQSKTPTKAPVPSSARKTKITPNGNLMFAEGIQKVYKKIVSTFKQGIKENNPNKIKIVAYRNDTRRSLNSQIRESLFGSNAKEFEKNDLIMMYDSFDAPQVKIENSQEFQVKEVELKQGVELRNGKKVNVWNLEIETELPTGETISVELRVLAQDSKQIHKDYVTSLFAEARSIAKGELRSDMMRAAWAEARKYSNVDYAYAITSHKSQGSTYETVVVLEDDIMGVGPTSNKTKSQSMYTAITRASKTAVIISRANSAEEVAASQEILEEGKTIQGYDEQIQSLWLNYQSKLQAKYPGYTYERLKQVVAKHGIEKVTENLKKC